MSPELANDPSELWLEAIDLAGLHACRTVADLDQELTCKIVRLLPGVDAGLALSKDAGGMRAGLALGAGCPWRVGEPIESTPWNDPALRHFPLQFRNHELGALYVAGGTSAEQEAQLHALLAHYAVALVGLTLFEESRRATDHYCANLQALQEGIVLFQQSDRDAVMARLLDLATNMLQATAGALYVLREIGDADSGLCLDQSLGIPESLLQQFGGPDGGWPDQLLAQPAMHFDRATDPTLGGLDPQQLPPVLHNLVSLPLCYHGVTAGIAIVFNVASDRTTLADQLERVDSLGQLGAALLHRFWLESQTARTRSLERELQIAEKIQERLLPQSAPKVHGYEFAWRSIAAQNIGGDYLDLLTTDLGDICALIADASGHGINSALLMSSFRSTWRAEAPWQDPAALMQDLNSEVVAEVGATGMFITAAHLRLEPDCGRLTVTSAGHNPLLVYRAATGTVDQIESHGPPLGFMADAEYAEQVFTMRAGDVLLLYTDGITEATDRELDMFGDERLQQVVIEHAHLSAGMILDAALAALEQFTGRQRHDDDVSLSVIKLLRSASSPAS